MSVEVGDRQIVQTTFTDEAGTPTSPSTVVGEYKKPSATVAVSLTPTQVSPGVWRMVLPVFDEPGIWTWYIAGTAGLIAADEGYINVNPKLTS